MRVAEAHRIWERIQHELPDCKIGERTVRLYVHQRKLDAGDLCTTELSVGRGSIGGLV